MDADAATIQALEAVEARRFAAGEAGDTAALNALFAPDMQMVHFRGKTQTRDEYVEDVGKKPRSIEVGPTTIKLFGDLALMTGRHDITRTRPTGEKHVIEAIGTRLLQKSGDDWRYVFIQISPRVF